MSGDEGAAEVLELEERMDVLQLQARMSLLLAARSTGDAEALAPVPGMVGAAEKVSDAAGDIAKVVLEDIGLPDAMRAAIPEAVETLVRATIDPGAVVAEAVQKSDEVIVRVEVAAGSVPDGTTIGAEQIKTGTGMGVIAVRRGAESGRTSREGSGWVVSPGAATELGAGDVVVARGTRSGAERLTGLVETDQVATREPAGSRRGNRQTHSLRAVHRPVVTAPWRAGSRTPR